MLTDYVGVPMIKMIKEVLEAEDQIVLKYKKCSKFVVYPSFVLVALVSLFYVISPIDLFPEAIIKPAPAGYIDDILVALLCIWYWVATNSNNQKKGETVEIRRQIHTSRSDRKAGAPVIRTGGSADSGSVPNPADAVNSSSASDGVANAVDSVNVVSAVPIDSAGYFGKFDVDKPTDGDESAGATSNVSAGSPTNDGSPTDW